MRSKFVVFRLGNQDSAEVEGGVVDVDLADFLLDAVARAYRGAFGDGLGGELYELAVARERVVSVWHHVWSVCGRWNPYLSRVNMENELKS